MVSNPDFQDEVGYEKDAPGSANLSLATNWWEKTSNAWPLPWKCRSGQCQPA
jgi:hypothetical protein